MSKHSTPTNSGRIHVIFKSIAYVLALLASGCAIIDSEYGKQRNRDLTGARLDDLDQVVGLAYSQGKLIVAHDGQSRGLAIVDTGTHMVTNFMPLEYDYVDLKVGAGGNILVLQTKFVGAIQTTAAWLNPTTLSLDAIKTPAQFSKIDIFGSILFFHDWNTNRIFKGDYDVGMNPIFQISNFPDQTLSVTMASGKHFVATNRGPKLFVLGNPLGNPGSDTIALFPPVRFSSPLVSSMVTRGDTVFAILNHSSNEDSSFVAVVDARNQTVLKTIPLNFRAMADGTVIEGKWYVWGEGSPGDAWSGSNEPGGVEVINLAGATNEGVVFSDVAFGHSLIRYTAVNHLYGYGIFAHPLKSGRWIVRKATMTP